MSDDRTANKVALRLRQTYCLAGAQFAAPDLEAGWKEIERLESELEAAKWISVEQGLEIADILKLAMRQIEANEAGFAKANIAGAFYKLKHLIRPTIEG